MSWYMPFAFLLLYWTTLWIVPDKKLCKGLLTKYVLKKIIPPKVMWRDGKTGHMYRYLLWLCTTIILQFLVFGGSALIWEYLFWVPLIVVLLDDYFFGDDDLWKKISQFGGNNIKWKMELPPQPIRVKGGNTA